MAMVLTDNYISFATACTLKEEADAAKPVLPTRDFKTLQKIFRNTVLRLMDYQRDYVEMKMDGIEGKRINYKLCYEVISDEHYGIHVRAYLIFFLVNKPYTVAF